MNQHVPTSPSRTVPAPRPSPGRRRLGRSVSILAATAAALLAWTLFSVVLDIGLSARRGSELIDVAAGDVAATTVVVGLLGWLLLAALERWTSRARRVWTVVAVLVCLLSLAGPALTATSSGARAALLALHAVVAVVLITLLPRSVGAGPGHT
jgi:hypothetical protein